MPECLVQSVSFTATANEVFELLERRTPAVVCISATPPAAVMHARHLCNSFAADFREYTWSWDCGTHKAT